MKAEKLISLCLLIIMLTLSAGCWNYKEVNQLAIVAGVAVDIDKKTGGYLITVEIINPVSGGAESKLEQVIASNEGETFFDGIRRLIVKVGKKLYWSHTKVLIVSSEVAEKGILPIIDFINRNEETRPDLWVFVSREKTAGEILKGDTGTHDTVSFHLNDTIRNESYLARFQPMKLWQFLYDLSEEGISPTASAVVVEPDEKPVPQVMGTAVFSKDKLKGWLTGDETHNLLFIRNKIRGGVIVVVPGSKDIRQKTTLEILENKTTVKPVFRNGKLEMEISYDTRVDLSEVTGPQDVVSNEGLRRKLIEAAENQVERKTGDLIKKIQEEYSSDIFGFGMLVHQQMPEYWNRVKNNWDILFRRIKVNIHSKIEIKGSTLKAKPIEMGD